MGTRDTMIVYDCDDESQFEDLSGRVAEDDLVGRNLVSSFAPDLVVEALNRGFRTR
ncbi:MAG: hypothetical protein OEO77_02135 [Acidimicrobiia bacterium]|nr:hypothetical protein [Acidimicrobiia bacterium]